MENQQTISALSPSNASTSIPSTTTMTDIPHSLETLTNGNGAIGPDASTSARKRGFGARSIAQSAIFNNEYGEDSRALKPSYRAPLPGTVKAEEEDEGKSKVVSLVIFSSCPLSTFFELRGFMIGTYISSPVPRFLFTLRVFISATSISSFHNFTVHETSFQYAFF